MIAGMRPRSNASATRATIRALRRSGRIPQGEFAGLEELALSTAAVLDASLSDPSEKTYGVAALARAHLLVLEALAGVGKVESLDPFAAFVAGLSLPTFTTPDD
jgi:hypothetical protein